MQTRDTDYCLAGGRTGHSMFKIPILGLTDSSLCAIPKESPRATLLRTTKLIIYDESLMQHRYGFEALDRSLQDIRDDNRPFGGLTVVFGGDFQQILPVVVKGSQEDIVAASLQQSYLWHTMEIIKLHQNMRLLNTPEELAFANWLLDVGHGQNIAQDQTIALPPNVVSHSVRATS